MASLRMKTFLAGENNEENDKEKRGPLPTSVEWMIMAYVASMLIFFDIQDCFSSLKLYSIDK
jgi:hypothetical protein